MIQRCERCLAPRTHPNMMWDGNVCQGCLNSDARSSVDWSFRRSQLMELCDQVRDVEPYNCVIAVSGGKDSHFITKTLVEDYGMNPLTVTVTDSFEHTEAGTHNLRNLITRYNLNNYTYTISHDLFVRSVRWAFEQVGNPLLLCEVAIYCIPYIVAKAMGIPLVFFGENSLYEYGATDFNFPYANKVMYQRCLKEASRIGWWNEGGISSHELVPLISVIEQSPLCVFMSYYYPWSSTDHLDMATELGFRDLEGEWHREGTFENFEQIDSYGYIVHLWMSYPRFGFQRTTDLVSRRIREGKMSIAVGEELINRLDPVLDQKALMDFCRICDYTPAEFWNIIERAEWNKYYKRST
jgi:N-acetyl sugar amidotransferase